MDENFKLFLQIVIAQSGLIFGALLFFWKSLSTEIKEMKTEIRAEINEMRRDINELTQRTCRIETLINTAQGCFVKYEKDSKKAE